MNKLYLLVYSPEGEDKKTVARESITAWLDKQPWATQWFYNMPNSIFIKSNIHIKTMTEEFQKEFGLRRHFFISVDAPYWGRLPTDHWKFF